MRRFEAIIQSEDSPGTGSLWLKDKKLWYFEGGWNPIGGESGEGGEGGASAPSDEDIRRDKRFDALMNLTFGEYDYADILTELPIEYGTTTLEYFYRSTLGGALQQLPQIPYLNAIPISNYPEGYSIVEYLSYMINRNIYFPSLGSAALFETGQNYTNTRLLQSYVRGNIMPGHTADPYTSYIPVYLKDKATLLSVPAIYHNAHLYTLLDGKLKVYNIDTNPDTIGTITELKTVDLTLLPTYIDLELGNTDEVKAYNLEQLQKVTGTQFFVHADYGIGVGSFNSGHGGETTIQTAGGDRVHYMITAEGECKKQEDRFEHSELFFNLGQINVATLPRTVTIRDSVEMAKFKKATSLAFEANNDGAFIDDVSMAQVSVNTLTNQRIYTSPDLICVENQDWNYIKAVATTYNDRIEIYLETI